MDGLAQIVEAADSVWAIVAIFLLGIYVLMWKYGGELVQLARENNTVAKQAHSVAKEAKSTAEDVKSETRQISANITTNHGSKNLGDAIDRLTAWMLTHMQETRETESTLQHLRTELVLHVADSVVVAEKIHGSLAELDDRLSLIESKTA